MAKSPRKAANAAKGANRAPRALKTDAPRGRVSGKVKVEPPILAPGTDPAQIVGVEADINARRAAEGRETLEYQRKGDPVSAIRFESGITPTQYEPLARQMGPFVVADQNLGHGRTQLKIVDLPGGGKGYQQQTALEQFLDAVLHRKGNSRVSDSPLQYDPKTKQRVNIGGQVPGEGGRAYALLQAMFHEDPNFMASVKAEFDSLPNDAKMIVYERIAQEFPNERTVSTPGGGRAASDWSPMAKELVNALHDGELSPERMAEIDRVSRGGDSTAVTRDLGARGGERAYEDVGKEDLTSGQALTMAREERLGPSGGDEWAPPDPATTVASPRPDAPTHAPDYDVIKERRFHSEPGSEANAPLDDKFTTTIVDAPGRLPADAAAYRSELEKLALQQFLQGKPLAGGAPSVTDANSGLGRYFDRHVKNMTVKELQDMLTERNVEFPASPSEMPTVGERRPTPLRTMGPLTPAEQAQLVDPQTYRQIEAANQGRPVRPVSEKQLPKMLAQYKTPQEQFDKNVHDFLYADKDHIRRAALERVWEQLQTKDAVTSSPAASSSGIPGGDSEAKLRNLMDLIYSRASGGTLPDDEISRKFRLAEAESLARDHLFTPGRGIDAPERQLMDAADDEAEFPRAKRLRADGTNVEEDPAEVPETVAGDRRMPTRTEIDRATGKPLPSDEGGLNSPRLKAQDERRIRAREKAEANARAKGYEPGKITEYGMDVTQDETLEEIRQMYLHHFKQNPKAPEGIPNGFYQTPSGEWMPGESHLWHRNYAEPSDHASILANEGAGPAEYRDAKIAVAKMRKAAAEQSGTPAAKAMSREILKIDAAIRAFEKRTGFTPQAGGGLRRPGKAATTEPVTADPMPDKMEAAAATPMEAPVAAPESPSPAEPVTVEETPKPKRGGRTPGGAKHKQMVEIASNGQRTPQQSEALRGYLSDLIAKGKSEQVDEINSAIEASSIQARNARDAVADEGGMGESPEQAAPAKPKRGKRAGKADASQVPPPAAAEPDAAAEVPAKAPEVPASEPDRPIDPMESAAAPEVTPATAKPEGGALVPQDRAMIPQDRDVSAPRRPREVEGEWEMPRRQESEPIDAEFEVHPRQRGDVGDPDLKRLPHAADAPDASDIPDAPGRRPWSRLGKIAAALGGAAALRVGWDIFASRPGGGQVDPFESQRGGGQTDIMGGGSEYGPMTDQELATRKPFHAMSPQERIKFLRSRTNQPLPMTMTRPY